MKKFFFSVMLVAATMASCTSETELKDPKPEVEVGQVGYVGFNIQLPTASGPRTNDQFSDGENNPAEYQVKDATLFLFTGTAETSATFLAAYPMDVTNFKADDDAGSQCTTEGVLTSEILKPAIQGGAKIYAYVMLNANGLVTVTQNSSNTTPASTTTFNSTTLSNETTFADFSKMELTTYGTAGNMLMTNAPMCSATGGSSDPTNGAITTLVELNTNNIFSNKLSAQSSPAGEVYVERAAAKITVTLSSSITADEAGLLNVAAVKYQTKSIRWAVNNVNEKFYNARQMKAAWLGYAATNKEGTVNEASKYRFVSGNSVHTGLARTYFAEDVNYHTDGTFVTNPTAAQIGHKSGESVYVSENTFDVDCMKVKNTTGLSVSVTFNGGKNFYTASTAGENTMLQAVGAGVGDAQDVRNYIAEYLMNNNAEFKTWIEEKGSNAFTVTMTNNEAQGTATVATVAGTDLPSVITADYINGLIKFNYYKGGVAYYNVLIQHFGDAETPWNRELHTENTIAGIYPADGENTAEAQFLGRYGIVRNNWYQIEIQNISKIGDPIVVVPSDDPDDKVKNYLSVKIHVMPWALRKQNVIL